VTLPAEPSLPAARHIRIAEAGHFGAAALAEPAAVAGAAALTEAPGPPFAARAIAGTRIAAQV